MLPQPNINHNEILIIEDDPAQCLILKMTLESFNYTVVTAVNGIEGYEKLNRHSDIRLVITDLKMPKMDGFDLIAKIRAEERMYTYILVASSVDEEDSILRALGLGADDYLTKPIVSKELQLRLEGGFRLLRLESQEELILSMAKMAEYRSHETGYHLERVKFYTNILARDLSERNPELGISRQFADEIARVSPLHDLGKIAIADSILHKPGKLTSCELETIKSHTTIGGSMLLDLLEKTGSGYLKVAYDIAMYHHEKWDGSGYPQGLKGEEIPIAARIMALADVYDAMSSKRCYKECYDHTFVKSIIIQGRGHHFDPKIVDSFLRQEKAWFIAAEKYEYFKEKGLGIQN